LIEHLPVMINEVISYLESRGEIDVVVDSTLGLGGYSEQILKHFSGSTVLGIDQDIQAIRIATKKLEPYGERFIATHGNFSNIDDIVKKNISGNVSAVVFDLGVSNLQLCMPGRGFSFMHEGPLDMRMDDTSSENGITAWDVINKYEYKEMVRIFREYGEERHSSRIASGIVNYRMKHGEINTTTELVSVIREILPAPLQRKMGGHPARKVFQALRIFVNDEMSAIDKGLDGALSCCDVDGLIIVISYHSLEDRIVKHRFREWNRDHQGTIVTKKPVVPSNEEVTDNYKARSAKLRVFSKGEYKSPDGVRR